MCLCQMVHKDKMKELNKEYYKCVKYTESCDGSHFIRVEDHEFIMRYNYRLLGKFHYESGCGIKHVYKLPQKYVYSSGTSCRYRYKV